MKGDEDALPWAITFAPLQPVSVTFADDAMKITMRGLTYFKGTERYPAMNISATYKFESTPKGFKAVRQGPIELLRPKKAELGNVSQVKRSSVEMQGFRTLLERRFGKVFEPEFPAEGLELPGEWKKAGRLVPFHIVSRDGWLVIAWKRQAVPPPAAPSPAASASAAGR
jgi:hypothetical protein